MTKKIDSVLKEVLENITPSRESMNFMQEELDEFLDKIKKRIDKLKIGVEPFVGGSWSKGTVMKKGEYDVDVFFRFEKQYPEKDFRKLTKKILRRTRRVSVVHGSRDYFQVKISPTFKIEVVPVRKVKNPKESENITDLSFSHVNYIQKKIKSEKILDEIKLAKAFCHGTKTYGAESYVHGFSGYSLELLVYHYKSFEKMLKELTRARKEKLIIDIEKDYKNKNEILMEMNGSKLLSPIILIDPTFKERNALAALTDETFEKFKLAAKEFLKNPKKEFFSPKQINLDDLKDKAIKEKSEFVLVETKTKKQKGDVAGTKLLKFHKHLKREIEKYFLVKDEGFKYDKERSGKSYFIVKRKEFILHSGPKKEDKKHAEEFIKEHSNFYEEDKRLFAKDKIDFNIKEFLTMWSKKNKRKIKEMYISRIKVL